MGFESLKKNKTRDNAPGLRKTMWLAERDWFMADTGLAAPVAPFENPGDSLRISDTHTFETEFGFVPFHTTLATGELTGEMVGDRESRTNNPNLVGKHPGLTAEIVEFFQQKKNGDWIVLVQTLEGELIQLGEDGLECEVSFSFGSGTVEGGYQGVTVTITNYGKLFFYEGDITEYPEPVV
ncbi:hypothetical protein DN752_21070 [Echinicola strongylocentroti]|uniref:Uncharacterized protein n=1 Tax=Echinicola strongylocentroti TaxID=1795355 RepID=A0A2Z4ING7_9BACT|nr:hypothetical protein [Echinicola strongylocentroti]AWW32435.1 hypothetical protein DN752_21070 [Echinicola strongylocentroti]